MTDKHGSFNNEAVISRPLQLLRSALAAPHMLGKRKKALTWLWVPICSVPPLEYPALTSHLRKKYIDP